MRARDTVRLSTLRLVLAAIKQREVDERIELGDAQVLAVLEKMLKQRKDSVHQYEAARRTDLADAERTEIAVIETYMPARLGEAELDALVAEAIAATGAGSLADMGRVMAALRDKLAGRADMAQVSARIRAKLAG